MDKAHKDNIKAIRNRYVEAIRAAQGYWSDQYERGEISYQEMTANKDTVFGRLTDECVVAVREYRRSVGIV